MGVRRSRHGVARQVVEACAVVAIAATALVALGPGPAGAQSAPISGTVRDAATGGPLRQICVAFYDSGGGPPAPLAGSTNTSDRGTYSFTPQTDGPFFVAFYRSSSQGDCSSTPAASDPFPIWYKNVPLVPAPPNLLVPPPGATSVPPGTSGVDVCLAPDSVAETCQSPGSISGQVVTTGRVPVSQACIFVIAGPPFPSGLVSQAITDAEGNYRADGVPVNTNLVVGIVPPFTGPQGPCTTQEGPPPPSPPGALQEVWYRDVFADLSDPNVESDPYGAGVAAGATVIQASRTGIDACLTSAPREVVPRPSCDTTPAAPVTAAPRFTG